MLIIFDLDGTLLNTIGDLGAACNHALAACGYPTHAAEEYPALVGNGINKLIERALPHSNYELRITNYEPACRHRQQLTGKLTGINEADVSQQTNINGQLTGINGAGVSQENGVSTTPETNINGQLTGINGEPLPGVIERVRAEFVPYYNAHNCDLTRPYDGIPELLRELKQRGCHLAVASNKYQEATAALVNHFFPDTFDIVFGERTGVPRKPHPQVVYDIINAEYTMHNAQCANMAFPMPQAARKMEENKKEGEEFSSIFRERSEQETIHNAQCTMQNAQCSGKNRVLYVGDSLVDIETARNAGVPVAACSWGFVPREKLVAAHPDYIVDTPAEIDKLIN